MSITLRMLAVGEKSLRYTEMKIVFGARDCDVEQTTFFFQFGTRAGAEVRRHAAVNYVEHIHQLPLLAFGGMDCREDQVIFVEHRHTSLIARCIGWVECQLGQKAFAGWNRSSLKWLDSVIQH